MANSKAGWTEGLPTADGDYFSRLDQRDDDPIPIRIEGGKVYEFGCEEDVRHAHERRLWEYLGPFTASDAEQLMELRKLAQDADDLIVKLYDQDAIPTLMQYEVDGLRGRLHKAASHPQKESQGK